MPTPYSSRLNRFAIQPRRKKGWCGVRFLIAKYLPHRDEPGGSGGWTHYIRQLGTAKTAFFLDDF